MSEALPAAAAAAQMCSLSRLAVVWPPLLVSVVIGYTYVIFLLYLLLPQFARLNGAAPPFEDPNDPRHTPTRVEFWALATGFHTVFALLLLSFYRSAATSPGDIPRTDVSAGWRAIHRHSCGSPHVQSCCCVDTLSPRARSDVDARAVQHPRVEGGPPDEHHHGRLRHRRQARAGACTSAVAPTRLPVSVNSRLCVGSAVKCC